MTTLDKIAEILCEVEFADDTAIKLHDLMSEFMRTQNFRSLVRVPELSPKHWEIENMTRTYVVEWSNARSALSVTVFTARQNADGTWYASASGFGCSRDYRSSVEAVRALLDAECCTGITIMAQGRDRS